MAPPCRLINEVEIEWFLSDFSFANIILFTPPPTLSPVERELDERLAESFQRAAGGGHVVGPIIREPLEAIYHVISSQHTTNPTILSSLGESWILDEWLVVGGVEGGNDDRNDDWNGARQRQIAWTTSDS